MNTSLQRIEYTRDESPDGVFFEMRPQPDGRFVLYEEAKKIIEQLEREIENTRD